MTTLSETHDPVRKSWIETANAANSDFPIQNFPLESPARFDKEDVMPDLKEIEDGAEGAPE